MDSMAILDINTEITLKAIWKELVEESIFVSITNKRLVTEMRMNRFDRMIDRFDRMECGIEEDSDIQTPPSPEKLPAPPLGWLKTA